MQGPREFYEDLWRRKQLGEISPLQNRDWIHRHVLDLLFDPLSNPRHLVALGQLQAGQRLLDIGCWDGRFLAAVKQAGLFEELYGIDLPPDAIERVKAQGFNAQVVDLNAGPLPFSDEYFDTVTALAVLEHVFDPYTLVRECRRILRPGGTLILAVPNVASASNRVRILLGHLPVTSGDPGWDGGHLHYFTKQALDELLRGEGFVGMAYTATGGRRRLREWWVSLLAGELICRCRSDQALSASGSPGPLRR